MNNEKVRENCHVRMEERGWGEKKGHIRLVRQEKNRHELKKDSAIHSLPYLEQSGLLAVIFFSAREGLVFFPFFLFAFSEFQGKI